MKSSELINLKLELAKLIFEHGTREEKDDIYEMIKSLSNFITTGSKIKKPVVKD